MDELKADRFSPHVAAVHLSVSPSLLSIKSRYIKFNTSSDDRNLRRAEEGKSTGRPVDLAGFKHLFMILLVVGNLKMFWADWRRFGLMDTLNYFGFGYNDLKWAGIISVCCFLFMPVALLIEKDASRKPGSKHFIYLHLLNCIACLSIGSKLNWDSINHPLVSTGCEANVIVTFLKLVSFAFTNNDLHISASKSTKLPEFYSSGPQYPKNLTLTNVVYFFFVPTLVYQPVYPKYTKIRWGRVLSLTSELVMEMVLVWVLMMQIGQPTLQHMVANRGIFKIMMEDYLSFSTVNMAVWLVGFFILFETSLNIVAELTKFADRTFYSDWWNASSVGTFWRDWNLPVSNFFRRHVYTPLRAWGVPKNIAANTVFLVSAVLHELLFGVATHNFNGVAFLCMVVQPLFILATEPFEKKRGRGSTLGNCVMWIAIFLGQPTAVVIYYLQWVEINAGESSNWLYWIPDLIRQHKKKTR